MLHVVYRDHDGEEHTVTVQQREVLEAPDGPGLLEKLGRPSQPMTHNEAQRLADEAIQLLGWPPPMRIWLRCDSVQMIEQRGGVRRPATDIAKGDTIRVEISSALGERAGVVYFINREADSSITIIASDRDLDRRLEIEHLLGF